MSAPGTSGARTGLRMTDAWYRYPGSRSGSMEAIDLILEPRDVVGVVGANEAGKSTLALVASGLAPQTVGGELRGSVTIDGLDTRRARPHELAARCGIVFQSPATQLSRTAQTVYEEVAFGPRNLGATRDEIVAAVGEALERMGIADLAGRDPQRLSGGQAQLVAIASILAMRPHFLVLDEPTAQLDPQGTELVAEAIASLASAGSSILIAEQKTDLLERVCHRILVLASGRIVMEGPSADVLGDARLADRGVAPPSGVRLRRALEVSGLDPRLLGTAA